MGTRTEPGVAGRDEADEAAAAGAPPRRRLVPGAAVALALGLAVVIVASDQVTKAAITARYGPCGNPLFHPVFGTYAGFSYVCNTGTAFSRFAGNPLVWIPVGLAAAAVCWLWLRSLAAPQLAQQIAFGLILGGATGNLIDRARLGYVVDFIDLRLTDTLRWYVFNVADASVCIGVALLALAYWRATGREEPSPPLPPSPNPGRGG